MNQNLGKMLKGITELQKRVETAQNEIAASEFDGSAANGLVKVVINGKGELKRVDIHPTVLTEDAETVGDLVIVATNNAHAAKEVFAKQKLSGMATGLLPLGLKIPGLG